MRQKEIINPITVHLIIGFMIFEWKHLNYIIGREFLDTPKVLESESAAKRFLCI